MKKLSLKNRILLVFAAAAAALAVIIENTHVSEKKSSHTVSSYETWLRTPEDAPQEVADSEKGLPEPGVISFD